MKREVTIQEALTELAAAKIEIESMQQQLVLKDKLLSSKDEKITLQLFTINQQKEELKQKDEEIKSLKSDNNSKDLKILGLEERPRTQMSYRFSASEDGARSTCLLFSLIECAKINNINPEEYLSSIFELAADTTNWTDSNWSELLPWNIKLIKKSDVSTVLVA